MKLKPSLLLSGKMNNHRAEKEGITEQRKTQDQMAWMQRMNDIRDLVEEIILSENFIKL